MARRGDRLRLERAAARAARPDPGQRDGSGGRPRQRRAPCSPCSPDAARRRSRSRRPTAPWAADVARVRAVREALGPEGRIRVDANGGWNVDEAEHAIHALAPFDLEYVEQPCATIDELAEIGLRMKYMGIPIAADESVRRAEDPLAVARVQRGRPARDQGAAARRHPAGAAHHRAGGAPRGGLQRPRHERGPGDGRPARGIRARARLRLRARHRLAPGGGCHARPARAGGRRDPGAPACIPTPSSSTGTRSTRGAHGLVDRAARAVHAVLEDAAARRLTRHLDRARLGPPLRRPRRIDATPARWRSGGRPGRPSRR